MSFADFADIDAESADPRVYRAELAFAGFLGCLGLDLADPHLHDTPRRVASMFINELLAPRDFAFTTFPAEAQSMIVVRDIPFSSICAHHFVPFSGVAHIGYIPDASMVGLSKLARTVDRFARQPQVQERLTEQIAEFLQERLCPVGLGVVLRAEHLCMAIRGVEKPGVLTVTSALRGTMFDNTDARSEFMSLVHH